jgi:hypothetical protein
MTADHDEHIEALAAAFVGRRVVVAAFGDGALGAALGRALVDAGVEVHLVTAEPAGAGRGFASVTACDPASAGAITDAMDRIGAVVQDVFECGRVEATDPPAIAALAGAARPLMRVGGAIVGETTPAVEAFVRDHAADFLTDDIRLVATPAAAGAMLRAAAPGLA